MQTARIASSLEARLREAEAATSAAELRAVDADRAAREVMLPMRNLTDVCRSLPEQNQGPHSDRAEKLCELATACMRHPNDLVCHAARCHAVKKAPCRDSAKFPRGVATLRHDPQAAERVEDEVAARLDVIGSDRQLWPAAAR